MVKPPSFAFLLTSGFYHLFSFPHKSDYSLVGCSATQYELIMAVNPEEGGIAIDLTGESPYTTDTEVHIKAEANPGYRFVKWTAPAGAFDDKDATETTFTMSAISVAVTANFVAVYELTLAAEPDAGGTVTDLTGASPYPEGTEVYIKAEANPGYRFVKWTAPAGSFDDEEATEAIFTMPAQAVNVTANFILFAGGSGTAEDPYQIADWHHLDNIRNYLNHHFIVINDPDSNSAGYTELASATANEGKGWQPTGIAAEGAKFAGSFDGQGHEICDLFINRPDESIVGLFGVLDDVGTIENVGVNGNVTGYNNVGGLVGRNDGSASNSYSTGSVTGNTHVGGLVGKNSGSASNSFWDTQSSGQATPSGGTGKTTAQMKDITTFSGAGWDIVPIGDYVDETWYIDEGNDYPRLGWQPV